MPCWGCQAMLPDPVTYCPRCGASIADDAQSEVDATRLAPKTRPGSLPPQTPGTYPGPESLPPQPQAYGPTSAVQPPIDAAKRPPSRGARTALALSVAFAVMIALGVLAGVFRDQLFAVAGLAGLDPSPPMPPSSARPSLPTAQPASPSASATASTRPPSTTAAPSTSKPPSTASSSKPPSATKTVTVYQVTVARTCGSTGKGDCFLIERAQPTGTSAEVKRWPDKSTLSVLCQVQGQSVTSSVLNRSSTLWSRTTTGGYVANIFLDGIDAFTLTVPC